MKFSRTGWMILFFSLALLASCGGGGGGGSLPVTPNLPGPGPIVSEGTSSAPKDLGITPIAYGSGSVAYGGTSIYQFKTTTAGSYTVSLTNTTVRMEWDVYSQQTNLTNSFISSADDIFASIGDLIATAPNLDANTTYYLYVTDWDNSGGTYHISITNGTGEGSLKTPITLTPDGSSHVGGIDGYGWSYYTFTTTTPDSYLVSFKGVSVQSDTLGWMLYSDSGFSTMVSSCNYNTWPETAGDLTCGASNLPAGTYYMKVYNSGNNAATYSVSIGPDSIGYAGTAATLSLSTSATSTIYDNEFQYYSFTPVSSGTYSITLTSPQDMSWALYSDVTCSTVVAQCSYGYSVSGAAQCTTPNLPRATYYLKISNNVSAPQSYSLSATGPWSQGAVGDPVVVSSRTPYTAAYVNPGGTSYYTFRTETLANSSAYLITLTNPSPAGSNWGSLYLYSDPAFSTQIGYCGYSSQDYQGDIVCSTNQTYTPAMLASNTSYYVSITNVISRETYSVTVSPLSSAIGCIGGTCYDFETNSMTPFVGYGTSNPQWVTASSGGAGGTGSYYAQSGITGKNQSLSCFQTSGSNVKWVSFSLSTNFTNASATPDELDFYIDNVAISGFETQKWTGVNAWQRVVFVPSTSGTHNYGWCHRKPDTSYTDNNAWVDDIQFNY